MKSPVDIFHIYYGTQGTAGLYLDEIYRVLQKDFSQKIFVSYYYPFPYGEKVFFRYSDILHGIKRRKVRLVVRYFELIAALCIVLIRIIRDKPRIVNFSLTTELFLPERLFLRIIGYLKNTILIITCHDVVPFRNSRMASFQKSSKRRERYFKQADRLLVHNESSKADLRRMFGIPDRKIIMHPFPIMDLSKIISVGETKRRHLYDFAFIGHYREEKGLEVLLDAWELFCTEIPDAKLLVAGNMPPEIRRLMENKQNDSIVADLRYIDDSLYCEYIMQSRFVVLPYLRGTNSGIASTVVSLGTDLIVSDIAMFKNNCLIGPDAFFKNNDPVSLCATMKRKYHENPHKADIESYRKNFERETIRCYRSV